MKAGEVIRFTSIRNREGGPADLVMGWKAPRGMEYVAILLGVEPKDGSADLDPGRGAGSNGLCPEARRRRRVVTAPMCRACTARRNGLVEDACAAADGFVRDAALAFNDAARAVTCDHADDDALDRLLAALDESRRRLVWSPGDDETLDVYVMHDVGSETIAITQGDDSIVVPAEAWGLVVDELEREYAG